MNKTFYDSTKKLYEEGYGKRIVNTLIGYSASDIGYRLGGTPQEHQASRFIASELEAAGLNNVRLEEIPVDSFELKGAEVIVDGTPGPDGKTIPLRCMTASQFVGFRGTPPEGITAPVVYVGTGTQAEYEAISKDKDYFKDKIVLVDVRLDTVWIGWQSSEATVFGAKAAIFTCTDEIQGTYLKYAPDMLIGGDGENNYEDLPIVFISKQDGYWLKDKLAEIPDAAVTVKSEVNVTLAADGGVGYNVTAQIPGKNPKQRILLAAHQDAHLKSAADDTGAVATVMTIAKAMMMSGYQPESTIQFMFTSSEEYGIIDTIYDWQYGAVRAITGEHKDWAGTTSVVLNYEVMPEKGGNTLFRGIPEVMSLVEKCTEKMKGDTYPASVSTMEFLMSIADEWCLCASGIPCISVTSMRDDYLSRYHTSYDKEEHLDYDAMSRIANASFDIVQAFDGQLIDYSLERRCADLKAWYFDPKVSSIENEVLTGVSKEEFAKIDIDEAAVAKLERAIEQWERAISVYNETRKNIQDYQAANEMLVQYNKEILSSFIATSVGQTTIYPYMQVLADAVALKEAVCAVEKKDGAAAMDALDRVNLDTYGWIPLTQFIKWFTIETCNRMSALYEDKENTWGHLGKIAPICNVYSEYAALRDSDVPDYEDIHKKLNALYEKRVNELNQRLDDMADVLLKAADGLSKIKGLS